MARKTLNFTITDAGRDKGKIFVLTEMPAAQAERWAMRAILALMNGGVELPDGFQHMGMSGLATVGIKALANLKWEDAEPLFAEMMSCVTIMPDATKPHLIRPTIEEDFEEVATLFKLRAEVFKLHVDFSKTAVQ